MMIMKYRGKSYVILYEHNSVPCQGCDLDAYCAMLSIGSKRPCDTLSAGAYLKEVTL